MSLLREIQDATTAPDFRLADVLRKAKILAARLAHQAFKDWIEKELNGYGTDDELPQYRILTNLGSRGDFFGPFGSGMKNAPIPLLSFPQEFAQTLNKVNVLQNVSAIENTVAQANQSGTSILKAYWSADAVALFGSDIYEHMNCGQAWRDIPTSSFVAILDTVRNRILDFVLEIEAEAPEAGEAEPGTKPIPDPVLTQIFHQCVLHQSNYTASDGSQTITNLQQGLIMSNNRSTNINAGRDAIGNVGGDNSGSIKNLLSQQTNADIDEILQLIKSLHQQIEAISPENQDVAVDSLETLEAEVITPTKPAKLKSALLALWSVGKDVVSFANVVLAIAEKFGIHLHK
jgi:hypothetical protein